MKARATRIQPLRRLWSLPRLPRGYYLAVSAAACSITPKCWPLLPFLTLAALVFTPAKNCPGFLSRYGLFCITALLLAERLESTVSRAGEALPKPLLAAKFAKCIVYSVFPTSSVVAVALYLGKYLAAGMLLLLGISLCPLSVYIQLQAKAVERARLADEDLPFLALWAMLYERSGSGSLGDALAEAKRSMLLPGAAIDAGIELKRLAEEHPGEKSRRFYRYYTAIASSGGDTAAFLKEVVRSYIDGMRDAMYAYAETASGVLSLVLGLIALGYLGSIFNMILGGADYTVPLSIAGALLGYILLHSIQPRLREEPPFAREAAALGLGAVAAVAVWMATRDAAATALTALLPHAIYYAYWRLKTVSEEAELPLVLRLVIERLKTSPKPVSRVLVEAAESAEEPLRSLLREAARRGESSATSWLTRYTLYTLTRITSRTGGADPEALERLYDLVTTYASARKASTMRLRGAAGIALLAPPIGYAAAVLLGSFASGTATGLVRMTAPDPASLALSAAMAATASSLVAAKASSLTVRNTVYSVATLTVLIATRLVLASGFP